MSTAIFPSLPGLDIEISRSPTWEGGSDTVAAMSGKETSMAYWSSPRYLWELKFQFLRSGVRYAIARTELQDLIGFFNLRQGPFDDFLFTDPDDNTVTAQALGALAGASIQLVRTFGANTEPVLAPQLVTNVTANGAPVDPANYTFSVWGTNTPGVLTFQNVIPAPGSLIVADIVYYWPVRFQDTSITLKRFLSKIYACDSIKLISKK
jgi:hypothetical protein